MAGRHRFRRMVTFREVLGRHALPSAPTPGCTVGVADGSTGIAHRVTAEAFAAGHRAGGHYVTLRGARVSPTRLTAPARYHCPVCDQDS